MVEQEGVEQLNMKVEILHIDIKGGRVIIYS